MAIKINFFLLIRILLGILFVFSGGEKLLSHHQNFLYVVQSYEILPHSIQSPFAYIFPWIEFLSGISLLLGLWLDVSLKITALMFASFIITVGQAVVRKLPITECGCFGELISFPLHIILIFDSVMFLLVIVLIKKMDQTSSASLDRYLTK